MPKFKPYISRDNFINWRKESESIPENSPDNKGRVNKFIMLCKILSPKEKYATIFLLFVIVSSTIFWGLSYYLKNTKKVPDYGDKYTEGVMGQPRFINPVLSETNDVDRDLSEIIFSGLLKYDRNGELVNDLADNYEISQDGKTYTFYLKKNVLWHDGENFNADDILFTASVIANPEYKSPLRINWQGVKIEKVDDFAVKFSLNNTYTPFIQNLTLKVIPKHIFEKVSVENFQLTEYNQKPIGTGPYKFEKLKKDKLGKISSIILERNESYFSDRPYIEKIEFKFFKDEKDMISAYNDDEISGLGFISPKNIELLRDHYEIYRLNLPRYFAIFFNQTKSKALSDKTIRLALNYATNKKDVLDKAILGYGETTDSPILPYLVGYTPDTKVYDFAPEHAKNILNSDGWKDNDGDGILEKKMGSDKEPTPLEINLVTSSWPELTEVAQLLKNQWEEIGARINISIVEFPAIQQELIKPREYQALLFGEVLGLDPDPFSFWHSSQKKDPGLNLALYDSKNSDKLLEEARETTNKETRVKKYEEFQKILIEDAPAVFLYSPDYLYLINEKVMGVMVKTIALPSERFSEIEKWYIKTKRIKKPQE